MNNTLINDLSQNLRAGLRLLTFRPINLSDYRFSLDQLMLLLTFDLIIEFVGDYITNVPDPSFSPFYVPVYALGWVYFFLSAFFYGKWINKPETTLQLFVVAYSFIPLTMINQATKAFENKPDLIDTKFLHYFGYLFFIYAVIVLYRAFYLIGNPRKLASLIVVIFLYTLFGLNDHYFKRIDSFWYAKPNYDNLEKDYYTEYDKLDAETLMYKQPTLLQMSLAELKPQRKNRGDIYFVGFASYAIQDVFYKEITYAKDLMDKRFDTQGRSINLVNHLKTVDKTPLATGTNLGITLKHIGKLINKEEDVLFLYLTSHGSREHELSVDFYPLSLNDITPEKLKTMLDEAGIKWRVVVVSACYSGGYVKPLANSSTLIATAAAADKTSFGCGNEFEFTYFGQALFKEQLNQQTSFVSALKQARIAIGDREAKEKKEPSEPQLSVGAEIEAKLNSLEKTVTAYQCGKAYQTPAKC